jgi:uncharacterized protein (DUF1778 family)
MVRPLAAQTKRPRISLDVTPELRRRLRLAAAKRDQTLAQYLLAIVEERLQEDLEESGVGAVLSAKTDPVLASLWDNPRDAEYDRL